MYTSGFRSTIGPTTRKASRAVRENWDRDAATNASLEDWQQIPAPAEPIAPRPTIPPSSVIRLSSPSSAGR
jgi:hypothetical protein